MELRLISIWLWGTSWTKPCPRLGQDEQDPFLDLLDLLTSLHATYTHGDMCNTRYANFRRHSPFERKFHRLWPTSVTRSCGVHGRVTNGAHIENLQINFISFLPALKLFHVCIWNRFENTLFSFHPNNLWNALYNQVSFVLLCAMNSQLVNGINSNGSDHHFSINHIPIVNQRLRIYPGNKQYEYWR
jgi:hypothetical protein